MARHIATTTQSAFRMFSEESVTASIRELCEIDGGLKYAARGARELAEQFERDAARSRSLEIGRAWLEAARMAYVAAERFEGAR